ncbi:Crp/Fnr family transcriptional regulator [Streptomyces xiamenensis]
MGHGATERQSRQQQTLRGLAGDKVWTELIACSHERRHPAGSVMLRQGEPGTHVLAIVQGLAKVVHCEPSGRLAVLAFRGAGELLGEVAVLEDDTRLATVEALTDCVVAVLGAAEFLSFATRRDLFPALTRHALIRLRESDEARGGGELMARLATTLTRLADIAGRPCRPGPHRAALELALTREELAQYLRTSRNTVSDKLAELGPGLVRVGRRRIIIDDLAALRRIASTV